LVFFCNIIKITQRHLHRKVRPHIEGRIDVDQVDLAPEVLQERGHHQLVIAPDEHVSKVILPGGLQLSQGGLTPGQGLAPGHVHGLNLLHGHGTACNVHRAAKTVLIILAVPDQLGLPPTERMEVVRPPADGLSQGRRPPGGER